MRTQLLVLGFTSLLAGAQTLGAAPAAPHQTHSAAAPAQVDARLANVDAFARGRVWARAP